MKTKIMSLIKSHWPLVLILLVAAALRLWKLVSLPPSLTPDEAALGYNAYSILKTGKDEYGEVFPIIFKSFGDYKPGLYVYLTVPFVALFGLNELSVRLPSAIAGVFTVLLIYLITNKYKKGIGVIATFVAATNPWLIHFSRGAWEANLSLTFTLAGIHFFLKSLNNYKYLIFSSLFFSLTFATYQGAKLSTVIVLLLLFVFYWKKFKNVVINKTKTVFISGLLGLLVIYPIVLSIFNGSTGRLNVFSVFSYPRPLEYTKLFLEQGKEKIGDPSYYLYHSEGLNFARGIAGRWFNHFSGKFLFFSGDYQNPRHSAPNHGMMLLVDFLLVPIGLFYLIRTRTVDNKFKKFVLFWLILSPLPAVLSRDQVQAVRAFNMAVPLVFITSFGIYYIFVILRRINFTLWRVFCIPLLLITYLLSLIYFFDAYFVHLSVHNARYWYYGYKEAVNEVIALKDNYDKVYFQQSYDQPYIYFLFYGSGAGLLEYEPSEYQKNSKLVSGGLDVGFVETLGDIEFKDLSWPPPVGEEKTLIVGNPIAIPGDFSTVDFSLIKEIKYPDRYSTALRLIEKNTVNK